MWFLEHEVQSYCRAKSTNGCSLKNWPLKFFICFSNSLFCKDFTPQQDLSRICCLSYINANCFTRVLFFLVVWLRVEVHEVCFWNCKKHSKKSFRRRNSKLRRQDLVRWEDFHVSCESHHTTKEMSEAKVTSVRPYTSSLTKILLSSEYRLLL